MPYFLLLEYHFLVFFQSPYPVVRIFSHHRVLKKAVRFVPPFLPETGLFVQVFFQNRQLMTEFLRQFVAEFSIELMDALSFLFPEVDVNI